MVPEKRHILAICGALAVAFALPGCAPTGYNANEYGQEAQPAANAAAVEASPTPAAGDEEPEGDEPQLAEEEITRTLKAKTTKRMGNIVTDEEGWTLYLFTPDGKNAKDSKCVGDCARKWPPALTNDGEPKLSGVDADLVGTVTRADGTKQLTLNGWPLYRFAADKGPNKWTGQGVGKVWFVSQPNGTPNLECLPKGVSPEDATGGAASDKDAGGEDTGDEEEEGAESSGEEYSY